MDNLVVRKKIDNLITRDVVVEQLWSKLEDSFNVIIFGGAIRDILFGCEQNIRDLDVVLYPIEECDNDKQDSLFQNIIEKNGIYRYCKNQFDGYKIQGKFITLDIWLLKDTWAFRKKLLPMSSQNLLKSVYLNIDAYAWNYSKNFFISHCDEIKNHEIDIVLEESVCERLNLIRSVVFERKYDICLSDRIVRKLYKMLQNWNKIEKDIFLIEKKHYGYIIVTKQDIQKAIERS